MQSKQFQSSLSPTISHTAMIALLLATAFALAIGVIPASQAQTFTVLHNFTGRADGANPYAGVTVGPGGGLYGTAANGGNGNAGTVFKLKQVNSSWIFSPLYEFTGGSDGASPEGVGIGPNSALYGTTWKGGEYNYGTVFELRPPLTVCKAILCYWSESVLHTFTGAPDGAYPLVENLAFDSFGNIYGTTSGGGYYNDCLTGGCGTVFELTPSAGGYTESVIHDFGSGTDGFQPDAGVVLDTAGNVYGTTFYGGGENCDFPGCGMVYQLMPSNGGWLENVLVYFDAGNGENPFGDLIIDGAGNLYGATMGGGQGDNRNGVVFELAPSGGEFTYSMLYTFHTSCAQYGGVAMNAAGDFFGVCDYGGANNDGWIFELKNCSETCILVDLHDFSSSDGGEGAYPPYGGPVLDANGNLYGTSYYGGNTGGACGSKGCGVVWEIMP